MTSAPAEPGEELGDPLQRDVAADREVVHQRERQQRIRRAALLERAPLRCAQPSAGDGLVRSAGAAGRRSRPRAHLAVVALHRRRVDVERDHLLGHLARRPGCTRPVLAPRSHTTRGRPARSSAPPLALGRDGGGGVVVVARYSRPTRCRPAASSGRSTAPRRLSHQAASPRSATIGRALATAVAIGRRRSAAARGVQVHVHQRARAGASCAAAAAGEPSSSGMPSRWARSSEPQPCPPGSSAGAAPGSARRTAGTPARARLPRGARTRACR